MIINKRNYESNMRKNDAYVKIPVPIAGLAKNNIGQTVNPTAPDTTGSIKYVKKYADLPIVISCNCLYVYPDTKSAGATESFTLCLRTSSFSGQNLIYLL